MDVTVTSEFYEWYLPTPRHRRPHNRSVTRQFTATIQETTAAKAPVAILQRGYGPRGFGGPSWDRKSAIKYRWWDQKLWARPRLHHFVSRPPKDRFATVQDVLRYRSFRSGRSTEQERRQEIEEHFARFLLVDGVLHERIGEPRYVVMTFGLGNNHGGTAVMSDTRYNSNIHRDRYFPLIRRASAIRLATLIAKKRGDTNDLPIKPHDEFEILKPCSIRANPQQEHGTGDPFLNKMYALSESGAPPLAVALVAMKEAITP